MSFSLLRNPLNIVIVLLVIALFWLGVFTINFKPVENIVKGTDNNG